MKRKHLLVILLALFLGSWGTPKTQIEFMYLLAHR